MRGEVLMDSRQRKAYAKQLEAFRSLLEAIRSARGLRRIPSRIVGTYRGLFDIDFEGGASNQSQMLGWERRGWIVPLGNKGRVYTWRVVKR